MTEDEMVEWHHRLNGNELGQTPGDSEGQGSLACCSPWACKESDTSYRVKNNSNNNNNKMWCLFNIANVFDATELHT